MVISSKALVTLSPILSGIYFRDPEITPAGQGVFRWDSNGVAVSTFPPEVEVRAIVEGQFMAKLVHAKKLGYTLSPSSRVLATGGASKNLKILQARQLGSLYLWWALDRVMSQSRSLPISLALVCTFCKGLPTLQALEEPTEPNMVRDKQHQPVAGITHSFT